jgi:hypothetical protein
VEIGLIGVGFVVLLLCLPHRLFGDDPARFDDIERLLRHGELTDGRYSLTMPLLSAPFVLLGRLVGPSEVWWATRFNVIVVAVGTLIAFRLLRGRVEPGLLRKVVLVLLFSSLLTNRLTDYNSEVLTATLVTLGILVISSGRHVAVGWAAIVIGVVNTPAAFGGLALVAGWQTIRGRRLRWLLPLVAALALISAEAWIRRGSPTDTGYAGDHGVATLLPYSGRPGFSYPLVLGVLSILFSFGRGLVFFTPGLLLGASARTRKLLEECRWSVIAMLIFLTGLVLVYARWWAWYGGVSWGPRFFTFAAVPASLFIAVRLHRPQGSVPGDGLTVLVLLCSGWVGVAGALAQPAALSVCARDAYAHEAFCWYVPEFSSLWRPLLGFPRLTSSTAIVVAFCAVVFVYLALPLVVRIVRSSRALLPAASSLRGWRF